MDGGLGGGDAEHHALLDVELDGLDVRGPVAEGEVLPHGQGEVPAPLRQDDGELGSLLDRGLSWQSPDKLKAIRLLGRQPLDAADSEVVALIFQACHVLDPQTRHASGVERTEEQTLSEAIRVLDVVRKAGFSPSRDEGDPLAGDLEDDEDVDDPTEPGAALDPEDFGDLIDLDVPEDEDEDDDIQARIDWQQCGAAFTELRGELTEDEAREYRRRLQGRRVDELRPRDPADARAKLRGIVDQAVTRLEAKREVHDQWASVAEANQLEPPVLRRQPGGGAAASVPARGQPLPAADPRDAPQVPPRRRRP